MWKKLRKKLDLPESYVSITLGFLVILVAGILTYNYFVKGQVQKTAEIERRAEEQKTAEEKPELPAAYTVAEGDTLWKIAEKHYQSGYNWVTVATANNLSNPDNLEVGQKLTVPQAEKIVPPGEILATTAPPKEYTVSRGDSLWKIAEREYGTGYAWTRISEYNNLVNPNIIHPGNLLKLPK